MRGLANYRERLKNPLGNQDVDERLPGLFDGPFPGTGTASYARWWMHACGTEEYAFVELASGDDPEVLGTAGEKRLGRLARQELRPGRR